MARTIRMAETMKPGLDRAGGARASPRAHRVYRHSLLVRVTHWVNAGCLAILLMSGLQIFNAHPALYWGKASDFDRPIFQISSAYERGRGTGVTSVLGKRFVTTGLLGWSAVNGRPVARAFPSWLTIPAYQDLATGRVWHFFFAWLLVGNALVYAAYAIIGGHLVRDLLPTKNQLRHIGRSIRDHVRFRFRWGDDALRYNVIQKLSYLAVLAVLLPLAVLSGLTMAPGVDAAAPWLLDVFGGRQSARTVHFVVAWLLVAFVLVHVFMVLVSGVVNNMRSMITGWYVSVPGAEERAAAERPGAGGASAGKAA